MDREQRALEQVLAERELTYLRVTKRGTTFTLLVGPDDEPEARLTHIAGPAWRLDLHHHSGRWEQTPFTGDFGEMIDAALSIGRLDDC